MVVGGSVYLPSLLQSYRWNSCLSAGFVFKQSGGMVEVIFRILQFGDYIYKVLKLKLKINLIPLSYLTL